MSDSLKQDNPQPVTSPAGSADVNDFEQRFLALANETNIVITAANVAYHLKVPIEHAQEQLLSLELNGVLQQQSDENGNTHYVMPNRAAPGTHLTRMASAGDHGAGEGPVGLYNPADLPAARVYTNRPAKGRNVNGLVLNVIFPGVGSLACGQMIGLAMLGCLLMGVMMMLLPLGFGRLLGIFPIIGSWVWSIIAGVGLLDEKDPHG